MCSARANVVSKWPLVVSERKFIEQIRGSLSQVKIIIIFF